GERDAGGGGVAGLRRPGEGRARRSQPPDGSPQPERYSDSLLGPAPAPRARTSGSWDAQGRVGGPPITRGAGIVMRNVLPTPGVLSTAILPPSTSSRRLTTCRPRPTPAKRRVSEASTW